MIYFALPEEGVYIFGSFWYPKPVNMVVLATIDKKVKLLCVDYIDSNLKNILDIWCPPFIYPISIYMGPWCNTNINFLQIITFFQHV